MDRCLLQKTLEGYRLHDLVLQYLQLTISMDGGDLAGKSSSRQARYLARLGVFREYFAHGGDVSTGGSYSLIALWNSVKNLDGTVNVAACYSESLEGVIEIKVKRQIGRLLVLLVRNSRGIRLPAMLQVDLLFRYQIVRC